MSRFVGGDHWAHFGDGNSCQIIDSREFTKREDGIKYTKFIFMPSSLVEDIYDLEKEQSPEGYVIREYMSVHVLWLQRNITRSRAWIFTDFEGEDTPASNLHKDFREALTDSQRLIRSSEAAKNRMFQELQKERTQRAEALKSQTAIIKEVARARGRTDDEGQMGSYDGGME